MTIIEAIQGCILLLFNVINALPLWKNKEQYTITNDNLQTILLKS